MPTGVPVATVAVDNSQNAALLALRILATENREVHRALLLFQEEQRKKVESWNK
jgi:phosphoribosylcarboxyaminoimidazole (NCAIR) mutase